MRLGKLIGYLERQDQKQVVAHGFGEGDSYRGDYAQVAFAPKENVCVASMLRCAIEVIGETFQGYKGGRYTMNLDSEVYIAEWGECGEEITEEWLDRMMGKEDAKDAHIKELEKLAYIGEHHFDDLNQGSAWEGEGVKMNTAEEFYDWMIGKIEEQAQEPYRICIHCRHTFDDSDSYGPPFLKCDKTGREFVSNLSSFPFKSPQKCFEIDFWQSELCLLESGTIDDEGNKVEPDYLLAIWRRMDDYGNLGVIGRRALKAYILRIWPERGQWLSSYVEEFETC